MPFSPVAISEADGPVAVSVKRALQGFHVAKVYGRSVRGIRREPARRSGSDVRGTAAEMEGTHIDWGRISRGQRGKAEGYNQRQNKAAA